MGIASNLPVAGRHDNPKSRVPCNVHGALRGHFWRNRTNVPGRITSFIAHCPKLSSTVAAAYAESSDDAAEAARRSKRQDL